MRVNHYLNITVISATLLFFVLWQPAAAGPPEKPGNSGLPGCLAKASELNDIVANQQETIEQQAARIEELEAMLKNFAAVPQTGQTTRYAYGDDGDLQMGVQWPDPRFTDNDNGTVTDNLTGLIWLKNANCFGPLIWDKAVDACNNLKDGNCGLSDDSSSGDWRLPNIRELNSLVDYGNLYPSLPTVHPFQNVQVFNYYYWSSSTGWRIGVAWMVSMSSGGHVDAVSKDAWECVWPVRGGN